MEDKKGVITNKFTMRLSRIFLISNGISTTFRDYIMSLTDVDHDES